MRLYECASCFCSDALLRLLIAFPADKLDTQGRLYWSGSRRLPTPTSLDLSNAEHLHFILAVTNILGFGVGLHPDCEVALDHPWRNVDSIKCGLWYLCSSCSYDMCSSPPLVVQGCGIQGRGLPI